MWTAKVTQSLIDIVHEKILVEKLDGKNNTHESTTSERFVVTVTVMPFSNHLEDWLDSRWP